MPTRKASAVWEGGLQGGKGTFKGESGAVGGNYSAGSRFQNEPGSNPEELLAAAHAACFSMALGLQLEKNGTAPRRVDTDAACTIEKVGDGYKITSMKLTTRVSAPNMDAAKLQELATAAKDGCPVSQALKGNLKVDLVASLV